MTDRTFGIEMEMVGVSQSQVVSALTAAGIRCNLSHYGSATATYWKAQTDGSVRPTHANQGSNSCELVSPILRGEEGIAEIKKVCAALATIGAKVNRTCGLHVHFGIRDLTHDQIKRVCKMWVRDESVIDTVMPESRRGNNNRYCRSNVYDSVDAMFEKISNARSFDQLQSALCPPTDYSPHSGRYHKVNLLAFAEHGTIEFRQHSGTVEANKICFWVEFLDSLIAEAVSQRNVRNRSAHRFAALTPVRRVAVVMMDVGVTSDCLKYFKGRCENFATLNARTPAAA